MKPRARRRRRGERAAVALAEPEPRGARRARPPLGGAGGPRAPDRVRRRGAGAGARSAWIRVRGRRDRSDRGDARRPVLARHVGPRGARARRRAGGARGRRRHLRAPPLTRSRASANLGYKRRAVSWRGLFVATAAAAILAPVAHAADVTRPPVTWERGEGSYTKANRTPQAIKCIVIHVTEGGFDGSVHVLTGGGSHASAHYVVNRDGRIMQLVHQSDIAWHAGNMAVNKESVGIEHVGMTYDPVGFPRAEYVASAKLAAWVARRSLMPIDRAHFIGHSEVPDPFDAGLRGGSDHHTDPGPYWNWKLYLRLVRMYASGSLPLQVRTTTLRRGQTVSGIVPWGVATSGRKARRVDFVLDGRVVWSDNRGPYALGGRNGWNTTSLRNGTHVLEARGVDAGGRVARWRFPVRVYNRPFELTTARLRPWWKVRGVVVVAANARGARARVISLAVDGGVVGRDLKAPYRLRWNTHRLRNGRHVVAVVAVATDGASPGAGPRSWSRTRRRPGRRRGRSRPSRSPSRNRRRR